MAENWIQSKGELTLLSVVLSKILRPLSIIFVFGAAEFWWKIEWENRFKGWKVNIRTEDPVTDFVLIPWHFDLCHLSLFFFFFKYQTWKELVD